MTKAILFLCLGNICRSPMAEGAMRAACDDAGLDWHINSAGTSDYHIGSPPDSRAIETAAEHGVDISDLAGRQLSVQDFYDFDMIIAMDDNNLRNASAIMPDDAMAELVLGLDLVPGKNGESVADPYYGGVDGFQTTWDDVRAIADALLKRFS